MQENYTLSHDHPRLDQDQIAIRDWLWRELRISATFSTNPTINPPAKRLAQPQEAHALAEDAAQYLPHAPPPPEAPVPDGWLELERAGHKWATVITYKRTIRPPMIPALKTTVDNLRAACHKQAILITPFVNIPMAERLRQAGIAFLDTVGNAHLDASGLLLWSVGKPKPEGLRTEQARVTSFTTGTLRLIYVLLREPTLVNAPYRVLAEHTGLSIGGVKLAKDYLIQLGFVSEPGPGGRQLLRRKELLDQWVAGYGVRLRQKYLLGTYSQRDPTGWRSLALAPEPACIGGELAAEQLTDGFLRGTGVVLHVHGSPNRVLARNGLSRDPAGPVTLMSAFWPMAATPGATAPPLIVYAELLASPHSRNWEAASELYRRHLRESIEHD